ncbi:MAG: hypothetical protein ACOCUS_03545, partial [Polyangiales bacterium]
VLGCSTSALAQGQPEPPASRTTFGEDAVVGPDEVVQDVVTMGGDARIEGEVLGDLVTMGGDADVRGGRIDGDVVTMGGDADLVDGQVGGDVVTMGGRLDRDGGVVHGEAVTAGPSFAAAGVWPGSHHGGGERGFFGTVADWIVDAMSSFVSYGLLFLLGLLLMGLTLERFGALQVAIVRQPLRAGALGVLASVGTLVAIVVLCITIIGIPVGVLVAMALPVALYVGLAACASVLGAALPIETLRGRSVLQLAAGCGVLFVASLVPFVGDVAVAIAALVGLGALAITRFGKQGPEPVDATPAGPYRTRAA